MIHKRAVIKALREARIDYQESQKLVHIWCPFHDDRATPSLVIYTNSDPVSWYCFGCHLHGKWDKLAEALSAGELDKDWDDPQACRYLRDEIRDMFPPDPKLPPLTRPWTFGKWRKFEGESLSLVHSRWWWDDLDRVRRILWPIWNIHADLVGWVGRDLDGHAEKEGRKYRNMRQMKATSALWPFPVKQLYKEKVLVLVEGITDALRLLQSGLPALAILGTTWSRVRTSLVALLEVERIVLAFDPGEAGEDATRRVGWILSQIYGENAVDVWQWSGDHDPGDAPEEEVQELKEAIGLKDCKGKHPWLYMTPKTIPASWLPNVRRI